MTDFTTILTDGLQTLRASFQAAGFDIRLVGGVVRDLQSGTSPKDIDLCTDADPDEQINLYKKSGVRYVETGLQHGTITVVLPCGTYEITSLRTESEHDGRHATVAYTRDWVEDLSRRDLTVNAMAMTFDGQLIDPFSGREDLQNRVARFVGNPDERIREDYLRILRWLRFHARLSGSAELHPETVDAVRRNRLGLEQISRERVWSEMSRIIVGPAGADMMAASMRLGVSGPIGMPHGSIMELREIYQQTHDPVTMMVSFLRDPGVIGQLAERWKWSRAEADQATFLAEHLMLENDLCRMIAHDGVSRDWVISLAVLQHRFAEIHKIEDWDIPVFPVKGQDLLDRGYKPGKEMGMLLKEMKKNWADSAFTLTKQELLGP